MNTIGDRIRDIRKEKGLTQKEFGSKITLAQNYLSQIEKGERDATEKIIKLICFEFNIDENWLRTGDGVMEPTSNTFSLDNYAKQRHMSDIDFKIIKGFLDLDPEVRKVILSTFKNALADDRIEVAQKVDNIVGFIDEQEKDDKNKKSPAYEIKDLSPPRVAESEVKYKYNVNNNIDIDAELSSYKKQLESERQNKRSSVLPDSNLG